jgi:hypothetical protein
MEKRDKMAGKSPGFLELEKIMLGLLQAEACFVSLKVSPK